MTLIDYESEYNNRARVPEHPAIIAQWQQDAASYRQAAMEEGCAELGISYGPTPRQTIDLLGPGESGATPLAMFVHGGYWRSLEPSTFSHVARGLNGHGVTVAVVGYDLCPQVEIADIITELRHACLYLWRRFGRRITVYGHSAGGHLTACLLATDWTKVATDTPADLVPAACAFSGLFDITPMTRVSMNADLELDETSARELSPLFWPAPVGRVFEAFVGGDESSEYIRQSRTITEQWGKAGVTTHCEELAGKNHFTIVEPLSDRDSNQVKRIASLCH